MTIKGDIWMIKITSHHWRVNAFKFIILIKAFRVGIKKMLSQIRILIRNSKSLTNKISQIIKITYFIWMTKLLGINKTKISKVKNKLIGFKSPKKRGMKASI